MKPIGVTADRKSRVLTVEWDDAHISTYPFSLLRYACPCAECRGGHDKMSSTPDPQVFYLPDEYTPATNMLSIEAAGAYALIIYWEDGHSFGIYDWKYLRALCPCAECRVGNHVV